MSTECEPGKKGHMKGKIKVVYAGYHVETLLLLMGDNRFDVIGAGLIEELLSVRTYNPVDALFKIIYGLRHRNHFRLLERGLLSLWKLTQGYASSYYYRYSDYLITLSDSGTGVVNFNNSSEATDYITSNRVDVMLVCSWSILPDEIVSSPKFGTVNVHPSRLPQYRGALPTLWSLKNGDRESAVTYFIMDRAIDGGAVIGQHPFPIGEGEDWYSMEMKIDDIIRTTLLPALWGYLQGDITPAVQDMQQGSTTGRYAEYMKIDWNGESGRDIYNKVNLYPFLVHGDYCHASINGRKIEIRKAEFIDGQTADAKAGQYQVKGLTLSIQAKRGVIACRLFSGFGVKDSILFLLHRKGGFD
jgi:methionyl-tRNA formyltransferase